MACSIEANHDWRQKIVSHRIGLRPHLDLSRDHVRGSEHPTVTLVEYGDYESSDCVTAARDLLELRRRFEGDLRVAFRHFPIGDAHPLALHAAEVAEAAGAQGRFWEMHDVIYARKRALEPALLRRLAASIGLDLERLDAELAADAHLRHIMEDFQSGVDSGVNGTPTLFINEERLDWGLRDRHAGASAGARNRGRLTPVVATPRVTRRWRSRSLAAIRAADGSRPSPPRDASGPPAV
jgi:2-hydroxychromene-2-carboxylate isomerase